MAQARGAWVFICAGLVVGIAGRAEAQASASGGGSESESASASASASADAGAGSSGAATPTTTPPASTTTTTSTTPTTATAAPVDDDEHCDAPPAFDPSSPRLDLSVGGGYAAYFVTWRQVSDGFMNPGAHPDGGYFGPLVRGEIELGLGAFSLSLNYTHIFSQHDGSPTNYEWALLSGEIGLQCACSGSHYVWGFGLEVGGDLNSSTVFAGIEHRSQFFVWEGLFLGFDFDLAVLVGLTSGGASGGGFEGSIFVGYSLG
jgi:hypothetical protein